MLVVVVISLIVVGIGVVEVVVVGAVVVVAVVVVVVVVVVVGATVAVFSKKSPLSGAAVVKMGAKTLCGWRWPSGLGETFNASNFFGELSTT